MIQPDPNGSVRIQTTRQRAYAEAHPAHAAPCFYFRALSRRDTKQLTGAVRDMYAAQRTGDADEAIDAIDKIEAFLKANLRGWQNVRDFEGNLVSYDPEELDRVINDQEMGELAMLVRVGGMTEDDLKKSDSPSPSPTAPAAHPANAGPDAHPGAASQA